MSLVSLKNTTRNQLNISYLLLTSKHFQRLVITILRWRLFIMMLRAKMPQGNLGTALVFQYLLLISNNEKSFKSFKIKENQTEQNFYLQVDYFFDILILVKYWRNDFDTT